MIAHTEANNPKLSIGSPDNKLKREWTKTISMSSFSGGSHQEVWASKIHSDKKIRNYLVDVTLGKAIDITTLKENLLENFKAQVKKIKSTRTQLFLSDDMDTVRHCVICGSSEIDHKFRLNIYGAEYRQCDMCGHCFLYKRPTKKALDFFYSTNVDYAATYTDKRAIDVRVQEVATPKAKWLLAKFEALYGRRPKTILDVGAGGGHFVYACKELGLDAQGVEVNESSRNFCKNVFGFEMEGMDFTESWSAFSGIDIVTFWGVIEHVAHPMRFLDAAHKLLSGRDSLVVAEVPRWDCISTAVQSAFPNSVLRHLDPLGHVSCFTDNSLATAFEMNNLHPVAAWYFGMDAYELVTQLAFDVDDARLIESLSGHIASFQSAIDRVHASDEIVLVGAPSACESAA